MLQTKHSINKLYLLILFLIFAIGENVITTLNTSAQLHKLGLIILCLLGVYNIKKGIKIVPQAFYLLVFMLIYWVFKMATDKTPGSIMMGIIAFLPVLIYLTFISNVPKEKTYLYKKWMYLFYLVECGIAIFERITRTHIFQLTIGDNLIEGASDITGFRSYALYGHPLQNAVTILVFILFILVYEENIKKKFLFPTIGLIAIFCFNSRAAIVISCLSFVFYTFYWMKVYRVKARTKRFIIMTFCIIVSVIVFLFQQGLIGGRLSSMGLYDEDSASVRVEVWNTFRYYEWADFITGINFYELEILKQRVGLQVIENFWLSWIFSYGLFFVIPVFVLYTKLLNVIFKDLSFIPKYFLILPFIACASTNPSLAVSIVPMSSFLLLSYILPSNSEKRK